MVQIHFFLDRVLGLFRSFISTLSTPLLDIDPFYDLNRCGSTRRPRQTGMKFWKEVTY